MFWRIYFWVLIILLSFYHWDMGLSRIWEIINLIMDVIAIVGLFGLSREKKILTQLFWKIFLPVCVTWSLAYQYFIPEIQKVYMAPYPDWFKLVDIIFSLVISILLFIALYLYGFKRTELWE